MTEPTHTPAQLKEAIATGQDALEKARREAITHDSRFKLSLALALFLSPGYLCTDLQANAPTGVIVASLTAGLLALAGFIAAFYFRQQREKWQARRQDFQGKIDRHRLTLAEQEGNMKAYLQENLFAQEDALKEAERHVAATQRGYSVAAIGFFLSILLGIALLPLGAFLGLASLLAFFTQYSKNSLATTRQQEAQDKLTDIRRRLIQAEA